jgi:hypothetical protein
MNKRMNKHIAMTSAALVAASCMGSAHAHGSVQWSLGIASQPRGVVMVPQTQYNYGAPPSVYAPPPAMYAPPPVYYGPPPVIYVQPPPVYVDPYPYPPRHWQQWNGHGYRR